MVKKGFSREVSFKIQTYSDDHSKCLIPFAFPSLTKKLYYGDSMLSRQNFGDFVRWCAHILVENMVGLGDTSQVENALRGTEGAYGGKWLVGGTVMGTVEGPEDEQLIVGFKPGFPEGFE